MTSSDGHESFECSEGASRTQNAGEHLRLDDLVIQFSLDLVDAREDAARAPLLRAELGVGPIQLHFAQRLFSAASFDAVGDALVIVIFDGQVPDFSRRVGT